MYDFGGNGQAFPEFQKQQDCDVFTISQKEVLDEVDFFHADKHQSFYKLALSFLMEVARHFHSNQNRKFIIFFQYIKKKVLQLLLHFIVMQHIQIFYWGPVMFVVTCSPILGLAESHQNSYITVLLIFNIDRPK